MVLLEEFFISNIITWLIPVSLNFFKKWIHYIFNFLPIARFSESLNFLPNYFTNTFILTWLFCDCSVPWDICSTHLIENSNTYKRGFSWPSQVCWCVCVRVVCVCMPDEQGLLSGQGRLLGNAGRRLWCVPGSSHSQGNRPVKSDFSQGKGGCCGVVGWWKGLLGPFHSPTMWNQLKGC